MNVCRICLSNKPRREISELKITENDNKQCYTDIIMFCLGIQVTNDSRISTKLCVKCFKKIIEFYNFKALALKNDAHLNAITACCINLREDEVDITNCIKIEEISVASEVDQISEHFVSDIKEECKEENESDDEYLSDIKKVKYEFENGTIKGKALKKKTRLKSCKSKKNYTQPCRQVCEECGKAVIDLKSHAMQHMPLELRPKLQCYYCDKVFASTYARSKHIKRKHFSTKKKCQLCGKEVLHMRQHYTLMHTPDKLRYECVSCGRRFVAQSLLNNHMTLHTKDRPYPCDLCDKKFRVRVNLMMHKKRVHDKEKSHLCQYCSKSFFKKSRLQEHLRTHTKEKPYKCEKCDKCFATSTIRNNHMATHTGDKNFGCTLCDMSFTLERYLKMHMVSHVKDKKYPCQYCGVKFHRSDHRKRHEFTAHLKHMTNTTT